jgi:hypothetical protein
MDEDPDCLSMGQAPRAVAVNVLVEDSDDAEPIEEVPYEGVRAQPVDLQRRSAAYATAPHGVLFDLLFSLHAVAACQKSATAANEKSVHDFSSNVSDDVHHIYDDDHFEEFFVA